MNAIDVHIERLRTLEPSTRLVPTRDQLLLVADDLFGNVPLPTTLRRPEFSGYNAADLAALAETFGKFLSQVYKGRAKATPRVLGETGFLCAEPTREEVLMMRTAVRRYRELAADGKSYRPRAGEPSRQSVETYMANVDPDYVDADSPPVIIPRGYGPHELGRNIVTSLSALVNTMPTPADVDRFWTRTYVKPEAVLAAEHLYLVRWLAEHDLGGKLDELTSADLHIAVLLVKAYDMLDRYRLDALSGARSLCTDGAEAAPVETLAAALNAVCWVDQAGATRVEATLEVLARDPDNPRLRGLLGTRLRALTSTLASQNGALRDIKHLNEGHVMLLCQRAGLDSDVAAERKVREQIRTRLVDLGFGADIDRELPAGLDAWRQGTLEAFYTAREQAASLPWDSAQVEDPFTDLVDERVEA